MALAGCPADGPPEEPGGDPARRVRPPSVLEDDALPAVWRPMRVRPQAVGALEGVQALGPEHLALLRRALDGPAEGRAEIAERLQREVGAEAVARALPRLDAFGPFPSRLVEGRISGASFEDQPYLVVLPEGYDPSRPWPLHIDLHGGGQGSHTRCLKHWGTAPGPFLLLCPTTFKGHWWHDEGEETALAALDDALLHFNVDTDRVSVGGLSNGGNGTWHLGHKHPWRWAALVPRCAGHIHGFKYVHNIIGLPIFMIHGAADSTIGVDHSRQMLEAFEGLGRRVQYTEVEEGGHAFFPELNAEVAPWLMRQRRELPASFGFVPTPGYDHGIVHWLQVWPPSPMRAELIDGDQGAQISVLTRAPAERLKIHLNASMVDLTKPVKVSYQGAVVFEGVAAQHAGVALESWAAARDKGRIFTAALEIELR